MSDAAFPTPGRMALFHDDLTALERRALYRAIWTLTWPAFLGQGIRSVVMFLVRIIISRLGDKAYNSVNIGMMVFFVIMTVIAAVAVGTTALVAQAWGAGDRERAGRILQQSILWGVLLAGGIAVVGAPAAGLLYRLLGTDAQTRALGTQVLGWLFAATPFLAPGFFLAAALSAAGDTRTPMVAGIIMGLAGLGLAYGLILGKLGLPQLGVLGAALALDFSFGLFTVMLGALVLSGRAVIQLPRDGWGRLDVATGRSIFKIGLPSAFEWSLIQAGMLAYISVVYKYGDAAAAGYFTGAALLIFAQTPGHGFQVAATTLVGQAVGARDYRRAESVFRHCAALSFGLMVVMGGVFVAVADEALLGRIFHELSPASIHYTRHFIYLLALVMPLMGVCFSAAGGLRGAGDTVPPLYASMAGVFGGRILMAFALYYLFHPPVELIWCSMFPDHLLRVGWMAGRLAGGRWKTAKV